jgi:site-specific recombinase XerD
MSNSNTFGVLFLVRSQKEKDGIMPIYVRITVDSRRTIISVKKSIHRDDWNFGKGLAKPKSDELRRLNKNLEQIRSRLVECYHEMQINKQLVTPEGIKNKFLGIEDKEHSLLNLFDYHNQQMRNILEWGTMKNYFTTRAYFQLYINSVYHTQDLYLSQLNYKFVVGYEKFMKEYKPTEAKKKPCGQNTVMKHIERLRKVVNMAIKYEWLAKDPFLQFKPTFIRKGREYLTDGELMAIENKKLKIGRLQHARDMFVFSCYTGLAYIDAFNLTSDNLILGMDGGYWISTARKKTDQPVRIPLLPKAMNVIEKYKNDPVAQAKGKLLPAYSNQKMNAYLKEIADLCEIRKPLTTHIARHTFATTVTLSNGVPIETVSKLLGHSSIKTTQIYAKVIEKKISEDMQVLREKLDSSQVLKHKSGYKLKMSVNK